MYIKPTLLLDEKKCKANIKKMALKAKRNGIEFRPHFKTHQSLEIGEWFREEGVSKITVSSVAMANYFAQGGWKDITIAFPVNILEIKEINRLASKITLNILLESAEVATILDSKLTANVNAFIKINIGNNRAGLEPDTIRNITTLAKTIDTSTNIVFKGFLGHAGHSYNCRSKTEIENIHKKSTSKILQLKDHFIKEYPNLLISVGDTPTCSTVEDFSMVDEFRPGVFVFHDCKMLQIGCCATENIATTIACPIVAIHKEKNELIIYGGSVHFASDILTEKNGEKIFGRVIEDAGNGRGEFTENIYIKKLSQEHGIIHAPSSFIDSVSVGDVLKIIPVHICTAANLYDSYTTLEGEKISRFRL